MFSFLMTESARARRDASNWIEVADKVRHYRRDELTDAQMRELLAQTQELRQRVKQKADASRLKLGIESLEAVLRKMGGRVYPKTSLTENVEFFLAAAIIILGIRAYIVQPFKIPTNSMWPSYNGMTHEVFMDPADAPGPLARVARFVAFGAMRRDLTAPKTGRIEIPFFIAGSKGNERAYAFFDTVQGRKWLVIPTTLREYQFRIGGETVKLRVPMDFDMDSVIRDAFFGGRADVINTLREFDKTGRLRRDLLSRRSGSYAGSIPVYMADVGEAKAAGAPVLSFDILTGDQLFVDRISYNFIQPQIGDGFVFRTINIPGLAEAVQEADGSIERVPEDKYFVKRLVGRPGDTIEIKAPALYRNGRPITGARSFDREAHKEGRYPGYVNLGLLDVGKVVTVPDDSYFALGDNSPNSEDGRMWGFVPAKDVIGRPLLIYYPLTRRWGLAH